MRSGLVRFDRMLCRALVLFAAAFGATQASAHDARPLSVAIAEQTPEVYRVVVRLPPTLEASNLPQVEWPEACEVRERSPLRLGFDRTILLTCPGGLEGRSITISYPLYNPSITTLFRLQTADGLSRTAVSPPDALTWTVPERPTRADVARDYVVLGAEHIWEGPDHLMFVAGLMLLAGSGRRILIAVTGFTVAHSITLSLAALGMVRVPIEPVEALIALSILFVAAEIARGDARSLGFRYPIALSFVFGLLHGFGFASALGEIGLPTVELATGLLFFNVGVEFGQIAFIAVAALGVLLWNASRRAWPSTAVSGGRPRATVIGAYALGIPAALWSIERTVGAFATPWPGPL